MNKKSPTHRRYPPLDINHANLLGWLWLWLALLLSPGLTWGACGDSWTWANPLPQGNTLRAVTYGNHQFVAVGAKGAILTSPDGAVWTVRNAGTEQALVGVVWSGAQFVAVGLSGTILTSPDGAV